MIQSAVHKTAPDYTTPSHSTPSSPHDVRREKGDTRKGNHRATEGRHQLITKETSKQSGKDKHTAKENMKESSKSNDKHYVNLQYGEHSSQNDGKHYVNLDYGNALDDGNSLNCGNTLVNGKCSAEDDKHFSKDNDKQFSKEAKHASNQRKLHPVYVNLHGDELQTPISGAKVRPVYVNVQSKQLQTTSGQNNAEPTQQLKVNENNFESKQNVSTPPLPVLNKGKSDHEQSGLTRVEQNKTGQSNAEHEKVRISHVLQVTSEQLTVRENNNDEPTVEPVKMGLAEDVCEENNSGQSTVQPIKMGLPVREENNMAANEANQCPADTAATNTAERITKALLNPPTYYDVLHKKGVYKVAL